MGLFSWFRKPKPVLPFDAPGESSRPHHYLFAHRVLPSLVWAGDSVFGILANPRNTDFLPGIWTGVAANAPPADRLPSDGLAVSSYWLGGEHLVFLVVLPKAERIVEAHFVALTTSPEVRYLILEKTIADPVECPTGTVVCEWDRGGRHVNFGQGPAATPDAFLAAVCDRLGVPRTVEPPRPNQLKGMSKQVEIDLDWPPPMDDEQEATADGWTAEAEAALSSDDFVRAEDRYRRIIELRLKEQGPANVAALEPYRWLIASLEGQARLADAEAECRTWWRLCRRHLMIGHAESFSASRQLADLLQSQGKTDEARRLLEYRVQFAGLARGIDWVKTAAARQDLERYRA